jgi:hypothetical protein
VIEKAIYVRLTGFAGLAALVGDKVFPLRARPGVAAPYIVYSRVSGQRVRSLAGPSGLARPRFQFDCYGGTYAELRDVATQLRLALDGFRGTVAGVRIGGASLQNEIDAFDFEPDPDLFRASLDFLIFHAE